MNTTSSEIETTPGMFRGLWRKVALTSCFFKWKRNSNVLPQRGHSSGGWMNEAALGNQINGPVLFSVY